jgi:hypothetical protein
MIPNRYHENVACPVANSKLIIIWQKENNYKGVLRLFGNREDFTDIAQDTRGQWTSFVSPITQSPTNLRFLHPLEADEKQVIFQALQELRTRTTCLLQRWFVINSPTVNSNFPRHNITASQLQVLSRNKSQNWDRLCARTEPNGYRIDLHNRNDYHSHWNML